MSRAGWEHQALNSIQSVLGHTDPPSSPRSWPPSADWPRARGADAREGAVIAAPPAVPAQLLPTPRKGAGPRSWPAANRSPDLACHFRYFDHRRGDSQQRWVRLRAPMHLESAGLAPGRMASAWAAGCRAPGCEPPRALRRSPGICCACPVVACPANRILLPVLLPVDRDTRSTGRDP
jgi:hypothetical protein